MIALKTGKPIKNVIMGIYNPRKKINKWLNVNSVPMFKSGEKRPYQVFSTFDDITDQKNAIMQLKRNEEYLSTLLKAIPDFVFVTDLNGKITMLPNDNFINFGFNNRDEIIGYNINDLMPKSDAEKLMDKLLLLIDGSYSVNCIFEIVNPVGRKIPVETNVEILRSTDNQPIGFLIINRDITSRIKAKEEIQILSRGIENSPVITVITDLDGKIEYVNPTFCKITGYSNEEVIGGNARILKSGKMPDEIYKNLWETISKGQPWTGELLNKKKNGELYWESVSISSIKNKENIITHFIGIKEDITSKKNSENDMQLFITRLKSIINILEYHKEDLQDFLDYALEEAIKLTNSKIGYLYFYNEETKVFTLNSCSESVNPLCAIANNNTICEFEETGIWGEAVRQSKPIIVNDFLSPNELQKGYPEGHAQLNKFLTVPVFNSGKIEAVIGVANKENDYNNADVLQLTLLMDSVWKVVDKKRIDNKVQTLLKNEIETKKLLQISLEQKSSLIEELELIKIDLENSIREKDKFFSIIAHDLKSPFTGFLGYTRIMAEEIDELSITEIHEISQRMQSSANNLYTLLENLLEWTKVKRLDVNLENNLQRINTLIINNINIIKARADIKEIRLIFNNDKDVYLNIDTNIINTVIRNLLSNAVKFTHQGGSVIIQIIDSLDEAIISIIDNGIGIPKEMIKQLFEIGYKTTRQGTANETSTGLGLLLCKEYVDLIGGRIWVESQVNLGSTFYFTIPKL